MSAADEHLTAARRVAADSREYAEVVVQEVETLNDGLVGDDILGALVALGRVLSVVRLLQESLDGVGAHLREAADARLLDAEALVRAVDEHLPDDEPPDN